MEDAEVLKELYETIKQNSKADYAGIIEQRASYPYLYHLSQIRENSFRRYGSCLRREESFTWRTPTGSG